MRPNHWLLALGMYTFLSYHARGLTLVVALSWVVSIPGFLSSGRRYFMSQVYPLLALELMALEPPFFTLLLFWTIEAMPHLGNVSLRRSSLGRRLHWATSLYVLTLTLTFG